MVTEKPCLADFARYQVSIVTTNGSRAVLGRTLSQKRSDKTIRPIAFTSTYFSEAEKNCLAGELEFQAVVCVLEKFCFYLYS